MRTFRAAALALLCFSSAGAQQAPAGAGAAAATDPAATAKATAPAEPAKVVDPPPAKLSSDEKNRLKRIAEHRAELAKAQIDREAAALAAQTTIDKQAAERLSTEEKAAAMRAVEAAKKEGTDKLNAEKAAAQLEAETQKKALEGQKVVGKESAVAIGRQQLAEFKAGKVDAWLTSELAKANETYSKTVTHVNNEAAKWRTSDAAATQSAAAKGDQNTSDKVDVWQQTELGKARASFDEMSTQLRDVAEAWKHEIESEYGKAAVAAEATAAGPTLLKLLGAEGVADAAGSHDHNNVDVVTDHGHHSHHSSDPEAKAEGGHHSHHGSHHSSAKEPEEAKEKITAPEEEKKQGGGHHSHHEAHHHSPSTDAKAQDGAAPQKSDEKETERETENLPEVKTIGGHHAHHSSHTNKKGEKEDIFIETVENGKEKPITKEEAKKLLALLAVGDPVAGAQEAATGGIAAEAVDPSTAAVATPEPATVVIDVTPEQYSKDYKSAHNHHHNHHSAPAEAGKSGEGPPGAATPEPVAAVEATPAPTQETPEPTNPVVTDPQAEVVPLPDPESMTTIQTGPGGEIVTKVTPSDYSKDTTTANGNHHHHHHSAPSEANKPEEKFEPNPVNPVVVAADAQQQQATAADPAQAQMQLAARAGKEVPRKADGGLFWAVIVPLSGALVLAYAATKDRQQRSAHGGRSHYHAM